MLFSSMTFIFIFLPIVLLVYFVSKKELQNLILLVSSIIFYAWGEPEYLAVMFLIIIINYLGGLAEDKFQKHKKTALFITLTANLAILIYFKYFNFLIQNINSLFRTNIDILNIVLPLGISFYTFQAMSYVIDVYRGECRVQKNLYKLALYICLFPQLIAGPIVKYHDIEEQINSREIDFDKVSLGVKRFMAGLSKKVLIANTMGIVADKIFAQDPYTFTHFTAWLGAFAYTFQLYFDFSGYSDMAIGLGLIFGFKFLENFNYPYISKSISEFWRRWHISLSTWFKLYVYLPLGGNRHGMLKTVRNLTIVFLLTGIWHGASWNFVVWGLFNGAFIIFEKLINLKELEQKYQHRYIKFAQHIYCILIFVSGWVIFRADNLQYAVKYLMNMFGLMKISANNIAYGIMYYLDTAEVITFVAAFMCANPLFGKIFEIKDKAKHALVNIWLMLLFILSVSTIASSTYNPFIYFRF